MYRGGRHSPNVEDLRKSKAPALYSGQTGELLTGEASKAGLSSELNWQAKIKRTPGVARPRHSPAEWGGKNLGPNVEEWLRKDEISTRMDWYKMPSTWLPDGYGSIPEASQDVYGLFGRLKRKGAQILTGAGYQTPEQVKSIHDANVKSSEGVSASIRAKMMANMAPGFKIGADGIPEMPGEDMRSINAETLTRRGNEFEGIEALQNSVGGWGADMPGLNPNVGADAGGWPRHQVANQVQLSKPLPHTERKIPEGFDMREGPKTRRKDFAGPVARHEMTDSPAKGVVPASQPTYQGVLRKPPAPDPKLEVPLSVHSKPLDGPLKKTASSFTSKSAPTGGGGADGGGRSGNPSNENSSTNRQSSPGDKGSGGGSGNADRCWICDA
jgi:hypothetical protein